MSSQPPLRPTSIAILDLIGRSGASEFNLRFNDDDDIVVWEALAVYPAASAEDELLREACAGMNPDVAIERLGEALIDGGRCVHCGKMTTLDLNWEHPINEHMPGFNQFGCAYVFDPELVTFRRSCESSRDNRKGNR